MVDALGERLDVAVEHGGGAAAAHAMPGAMHFRPFLGGFFAAADFVADLRIKYLRAAAGQRAEAFCAQKFQRRYDWQFENAVCEVSNLNGGESLDDKVRVERAEFA